MKKADSLRGIVEKWMELPESERTTLNFPDFYHQLETNNPELLTSTASLTCRNALASRNK